MSNSNQQTTANTSAKAPDDGGKAFPSDLNWPQNRGLSIRDYFAAHALIGHILADAIVCKVMFAGDEPMNMNSHDEYAAEAYCAADAMLEARK